MATGKGQSEAAKVTGYGPIWLRRVGDFAVVEVEIEGKWVEVIRESLDRNFDHCVQPLGILKVLEGEGGGSGLLRSFTRRNPHRRKRGGDRGALTLLVLAILAGVGWSRR